MIQDAYNIRTWPTRIAQSRIRVLVSIQGQPVSKQRPRFTTLKNGRTYTPRQTRESEDWIGWHIKAAYQALMPDANIAFGVRILFYQTDYQRRDLDNMIKLILDACKGIVWNDDYQVQELSSRVARGITEAKTELCIYTLGILSNPAQKCPVCNKQFRTYPSWQEQKRIYCSHLCHVLATRTGFQRPCAHCGTLVYRPLYRAKAAHEVFCSPECAHLHRTIEYECAQCGMRFRKPRRSKQDTNRRFCSYECHMDFRKAHRTLYYRGICSICGNPTSKLKYTRCFACALKAEFIKNKALAPMTVMDVRRIGHD